MRSFSKRSLRWSVGCSLVVVPVFIACSSSSNPLTVDDDGGTFVPGDDASGSSSGIGPSSSGNFGGFDSGNVMVNGDTGPCKGGFYKGSFGGQYNSHLTVIGIPIPVTGDVQLTLFQEGTSGQQCMVEGEFEQCSDVFSLQNGTIQGTADEVHLGDASFGGFPYYCSLTGTLDCKDKVLVDGWIQCTYCIGPLVDGGGACFIGNGVAGTTGVGGHFAGPLTANYDYGSLAFVMGSWNGAESLAGNDGGSPGPDGGPYQNYLNDAGYIGPTDYGGLGTWNAVFQK
jgi:hypothetical protein